MIDIAFLASAIRLSTPLTFAAIGGLYCERGGIANIALEGFMLFGAFAAAATAYYTGNPWFGVFGGCAAGIIAGVVHAIVCLRFNGNQIVSGAAINILALGTTAVLCSALFGTPSSSPLIVNTISPITSSLIENIPMFGSLLTQISLFDLLSVITVIITMILIRHSRFGLRLTASGDNPYVLDAAGVSVTNYRLAGILISGALAGLGGAYLSIVHGTQFIRNMTAGRGFIALAALILGNWRPGYVLLACFFFGLLDALQIRLQGYGILPVEIIQTLPYLITIIVLTGIFGKSKPPESLGKPYRLQEKN